MQITYLVAQKCFEINMNKIYLTPFSAREIVNMFRNNLINMIVLVFPVYRALSKRFTNFIKNIHKNIKKECSFKQK